MVDVAASNPILANSIFGNRPGMCSLPAATPISPPPVLAAYQLPGKVQITGTLTGLANTTYVVEIFATPTSVAGQGQTLLGSLNVTTDPDGVVPFVFSSNLLPADGTWFTATATSPANNTSSFSAAIAPAGSANSLYVSSVYGLLLNRVPDSGASNWIIALNNGATPASVVLGIEGSSEYFERSGGRDLRPPSGPNSDPGPRPSSGPNSCLAGELSNK